MDYQIQIVEVAPTILAAAQIRMVPWAELRTSIRRLLDQVHMFLGSTRVLQGHNVCLYRSPSLEGVSLEVGVQVTERFESGGPIFCSTTPSGPAASTVHFGPYEELATPHAAVDAWCLDHGRAIADVRWEIYGDWDDDPAQRRTDVFRLLRA